ncbi:extracellular solute-binding protein [Paenibacillus lemnae]|uniref:Extracellular solute-binding protein n=1 Tax=Paenibacillus lemnae TaxID=1330551 RepID=A0A848M358_PAELE|nr:extracellular solute-binding protein [Paenibacillus lemnae]NMO95448.1 extracellular solute-binding protein [Paenibacillus lemnae]
MTCLKMMLLTAMILAGCKSSEYAELPVAVDQNFSKSSLSSPDAVMKQEEYLTQHTTRYGELSWREDTSPFSFTQFFYGNWAGHYVWRDQYAMKLITEKTGVRIDRKLSAGSDEDDLNMMISTGELPDTIMVDWNSPAVAKLIDGGLVYSMNELINRFAPGFWNILDPDMVKYHAKNGLLWYLPNVYEQENRLKEGKPVISIRPWFIRRDIYEQLGKPKLETVEDLKNILTDIKQQGYARYPLALDFFDVAKNGFSGSLSLDYLIYTFAPYLQEERIIVEEKKILYPMRHSGFIEAFRFVNRLYREELLDPKFLIAKQVQYEEGMYRAEYAVASQFLNGMYSQFNPTIGTALGKEKTYLVLDGLKAGDRILRFPASRLLGWQGFFITKKAKNPERIIRFAEYAWSDEGQLDFLYGKEGETFTMESGLPRYVPEVRELMNKDYLEWQQQYGFGASTLLWRDSPMLNKAELREMILSRPDEYNASMKLSRFGYDDYPLGMSNLEPEGSSREGVINANIKELWNKAILHLIMAASDAEFDNTYKTFIDMMDAAGAQEVERAMYQNHLQDLAKKGITAVDLPF